MEHKSKSAIALLLLLAVGGLWAAAAAAPSGEASAASSAAAVAWADSTVTLGEVGVTAIKATTAPGRLPTAATVVGERDVERLRVSAVKGLTAVAPNFFAPDYGSRMTSSIYIRGLGARIDQPVAGLNIDNVPYLNKDNYDFDLADIERVEVLRGPQSALYGRNTMGGLVNVYTLSPLRVHGLRALLEYGSRNSVRASAAYYATLAPGLGMSLGVNAAHTDGFFRNACNGQKADKEHLGGARWRTVWAPSEALSVENTASLQLVRQGGYPYASAETRRVAYNDTCFYRRTAFADGLTISWRAGAVELSSISSVQYSADRMTLDQDFLPVDYFTLTQRRHEWAVTQDFVAKGAAGSHYKWLAGAFGFHRHTSMWAPVTFKAEGIERMITGNIPLQSQWHGDSFVLGSDFSNPVEGGALYHQGSWQQGRWTFTAGLRLDIEHTALTYNSRCATGLTVYVPAGPMGTMPVDRDVAIDDHGHLSETYVELLPSLAVSCAFGADQKSNAYVSVARGYKSGGFNTQMFSDILQQRMMAELGQGDAAYDPGDIVAYRPEQSWNYELGAHLALDGGRLALDAAIFFIRCIDQQLTVFPDQSLTGRRMTNAGRTRSYGAELAARWHTPLPGLSLTLAYGYTNARFRRYTSQGESFRGRQIPYAPSNTLHADAAYRVNVNKGSLASVTFNAGVSGAGRIMWDDANSISQPFYALLNASLTLDCRQISLTLWGENLTATDYDTFFFESIGNQFVQRGKPRHFGATLRFNF